MLKNCTHCNNGFNTKDKRQKYCCRECYHKDKKPNKLSVSCKNCGKSFKRYPSEILKNVYCSKKCLNDYNRVILSCEACGKQFERAKSHYGNNIHNYCSYECSNLGFSKFYKGENNPNFLNTHTNCAFCNKEIYRKKVEFKRSDRFFCSRECQGKWQSDNISGENHPNYDSSISELDRERGRNHEGYWSFRKTVYERDHYSCTVCGYSEGGILNAHHLNSYSWDIENRTNPDNAVTLCETCHRDFHSIYGNRNNTKDQFTEYKQRKTP